MFRMKLLAASWKSKMLFVEIQPERVADFVIRWNVFNDKQLKIRSRNLFHGFTGRFNFATSIGFKRLIIEIKKSLILSLF